MAGTLCSRSASAARLASSWSAPDLLPSSMSMLACNSSAIQDSWWQACSCTVGAHSADMQIWPGQRVQSLLCGDATVPQLTGIGQPKCAQNMSVTSSRYLQYRDDSYWCTGKK